MVSTKIQNSTHYKIFHKYIMDKSIFLDPSLDGNVELEEEVYIDEREKCKCQKDDCEACDPDWIPGIDTEPESETDESDYDSDDSMDSVYEDCGLSRKEKKMLQDELNALIEEAESIQLEQDPEH